MNKLRIICIIAAIWFASTGMHAGPRVVSLAPSITEMMYLLQADNTLVGCSSYCKINPGTKIPIIASAVDVYEEKVILTKPTYVFATSLTKPGTLETFRKMGIKVELFPYPESFEAICHQFLRIAAIVGKQPLAQSIIATQKARLAALGSTKKEEDKPKVFFQIGAKPLFTAVSKTFMDQYITMAGGINIFGDITNGSITREAVLVRNPDVIFIVTMGVAGENEKQTWLGYPTLNAVKTKRIFEFESAKCCSPTPVTFVDIVEKLQQLLTTRSAVQPKN